jgi:hypothetical protein
VGLDLIDVGTLLRRGQRESLYQEIMTKLRFVRYEKLWGVLGIYNIQDLTAFIDQPSRMYQTILAIVLEIEPRFPTTPHALPGGEYIADSDTIIDTVLALQYMKDMIKKVLNSSILGLVDDDCNYNLSHYRTYRGMMVRKGSVWTENIERYSQNGEIQSQYQSLDADTMIDAQDETLTLNSTPDQHAQDVDTRIKQLTTHPEKTSIGSNRDQMYPATSDAVTHRTAIIRNIRFRQRLHRYNITVR